MRWFVSIVVLFAVAVTGAEADSAPSEPIAPTVHLYSLRTINDAPVAAVQTAFKTEPGQAVRIAVYDSEERFLETPRAKGEGKLNAAGVAIVPLDDLEPGEYSIAAYLDENGDGKLNRGKILGFPKEPVAFSNGVTPKLRKPRFDETKVDVAPGGVVVITLED